MFLSVVSILPSLASAIRLTNTEDALLGLLCEVDVFKNDKEATFDCSASGVPSPLPSPIVPPVRAGTIFSMLAVAPSVSFNTTGPVPSNLTTTPSGKLLKSTTPDPLLSIVRILPSFMPVISIFSNPVPVTFNVVLPVMPLVVTVPVPVLLSVTRSPGLLIMVLPLLVTFTVLPFTGFGTVVVPLIVVSVTVLPSAPVIVMTGVGSGAGGI